MKFSKSPPWLVALFGALQPEVGGERRQMFGYPCAFENGQLFTGLFQDSLFVRLGERERAALLQEKGAAAFDPMKGRPMKEYVVLPPAMLEDEEAVTSWMRRGRDFVRSLPPKQEPAPAAKPARATRRRR